MTGSALGSCSDPGLPAARQLPQRAQSEAAPNRAIVLCERALDHERMEVHEQPEVMSEIAAPTMLMPACKHPTEARA